MRRRATGPPGIEATELAVAPLGMGRRDGRALTPGGGPPFKFPGDPRPKPHREYARAIGIAWIVRDPIPGAEPPFKRREGGTRGRGPPFQISAWSARRRSSRFHVQHQISIRLERELGGLR